MPHTLRTRAAWLVLTLALVGTVSAQCRFEAPRELDLDLDGVRTVRIVSQAGDLRVTGSADADTLTARGRACASNRSLLDDIRLVSSRDGSVLVLRAETPSGGWWFAFGHLDLVVVLPDTLALEIDDGSGHIVVARVASLRLTDGSGDVRIEDVAGDLVLADGSGDIEVHGVGGRIEVVRDGSGDIDLGRVAGSVEVLRDGSGDIEVTDVGGSVRIVDDASGGIRIEDVRGDVRIDEDGSGDVDVRRVSGDFVLLRDGSGSVRYADVAGTVQVP
jgi:hypothetical protein